MKRFLEGERPDAADVFGRLVDKPVSPLTGWHLWIATFVVWSLIVMNLATTAIFGLSRSASVSPSAFHCARRTASRGEPGSKLLRSALRGPVSMPAILLPEAGSREPGANKNRQ